MLEPLLISAEAARGLPGVRCFLRPVGAATGSHRRGQVVSPGACGKGDPGPAQERVASQGSDRDRAIDRVYEANHGARLRIFDSSRVADGEFRAVAFFDIYLARDEGRVQWDVELLSVRRLGIVVVSGNEKGRFVLRPD